MRKLSKASYGTTPFAFEHAMKRALSETKNPARTKRTAFVMAMAILMLALACTAVAVGFSQSARYSTLNVARNALYEEYDLTPETLSIFSEHVQETDGQWIVRFTPIKYDVEAIGIYSVSVKADGSTEATWTNDGTPLSPDDGFHTAVWGQTQLEAALALDSEHFKQLQDIAWTSKEDWSLEERAEMDAALAAAGKLAFVVNVAPGPDDIQEEDAIALAKDTIIKWYGIPPEYLQDFSVNTKLLKYQDEDEKQYRFILSRKKKIGKYAESFWVDFAAQSGTITTCTWIVESELRFLPEGDLDGYETAMKKFVETGAFQAASAASKADIAARAQSAGYGELLPFEAYTAPQTGDINEADALKLAHKAMGEAFGFTEETLGLFQSSFALILDDGERLWAIDYAPIRQESFRWYLGRQLGTYQVLLAADGGDVVAIEWSLMDEWPDEGFTETTWGQAPVLHAKLLPWAMELLAYEWQYYEDWSSPMPNPELSLEDSAALDQLFRDRGFPVEHFANTLPGEDEITLEEATSIAKELLYEDFGIAENRIDNGDIYPAFTMGGPEQNVWKFQIIPSENSGQENYWITIDAATGEVLHAANVGVGLG